MAGSPLTELADQVTAHFASYDPQNLADLEGLFQDVPEFYEGLLRAFQVIAEKFDSELPVKPVVSENFREQMATLAGLRDHAQEANGIFQEAHADEIERIKNPRPGEKLWDVTQQ